MAALIIRDVDEELKAKLKRRAASNGRSMEAELRAILRAAIFGHPQPESGLGSAIHRRFADLGGVELELPTRSERPRAASFD